jgi:hypothetical protein
MIVKESSGVMVYLSVLNETGNLPLLMHLNVRCRPVGGSFGLDLDLGDLNLGFTDAKTDRGVRHKE